MVKLNIFDNKEGTCYNVFIRIIILGGLKMFAMGDRVVYPLHGGAIIKDIEAHIQDGETVKYYILQMLF